MRELHVRSVSQSIDPTVTQRRSERWSLHDIKTFLEKFLIYKRDFVRIAEFLPYKKVKDLVNFYYACKKYLKLSSREKEVRECLGNQLTLIHEIVEKVYEDFFSTLKQPRKDLHFEDTYQGYTLN